MASPAMLRVPRQSQAASRRQRRPLRRLALLGAASAALALVAAAPHWCELPARGGLDAFAATLLREPAVRELPRAAKTATVEPGTRTKTEAAEETEAEAKDDKESSENSTDFNITLQLGSGFPGDDNSRFDLGPSWAMCHVMYVDRSGRDEHGSVTPRTVLEEWAMKGASEHVSAFKSWRQQTLDVESDMRCHSASQKAIEEVRCLACVPRGGGLPLTPTGHLSETQPGPLANTYILTIGGMDQCLASSHGSGSFCKSGSVAVSM